MKVRPGAQAEVRGHMSKAEVSGRIKRARKRSRRSYENLIGGMSMTTVLLFGGVAFLYFKSKPAA